MDLHQVMHMITLEIITLHARKMTISLHKLKFKKKSICIVELIFNFALMIHHMKE
jgi:hypothetical protein